VTTQEARQQARDDALLTAKGFDQGYVVLQPSRWLWRFWLEIESFNRALQRAEAESLVLLDSRQTDFRRHLDAFLAALEDYRVTTRRLTRHAHALASRRVKELEHLTRQEVDAWRDDPVPRGGDAAPLDALPPAALAAAALPADPSLVPPPGAEALPLGPALTALFGPSLAEERAAAQAAAPA
jgi:hypothetical protein